MNERTFLRFIAVLCVALVVAGIMGASVAWAAGYPRWIVPGVVMSLLAFWIGASVASVLKQAQDEENKT